MDTPPTRSLPSLPARANDGHKGTFGTIGIIAGSEGSVGTTSDRRARMIGAPALVAMGANRAGSGLVKIACPDPILNAVLTLAPFATGYPIAVNGDGRMDEKDAIAALDRLSAESDALVVGPGLGDGVESLVEHSLTMDTRCRAAALVLDADGINALAEMGCMISKASIPTIITPHPGEAQRLMVAMSIDGDPAGSESQRIACAMALAQRLGMIVVLKGMGTIVSDGHTHWMCTQGHPCLGTGGTGDVLSGMIASVIAQSRVHGKTPSVGMMDAACIAVDAHARAGEVWASTTNAHAGLDPRDLGPLIPPILEGFRSTLSSDA